MNALTQRIDEVNALMRAHAGGITLERVHEDGRVAIRFIGKCTGCELRPLTMAGTVRPALEAVPGVTAVEAAGTRVSEEAERRLAESSGGAEARAALWRRLEGARRVLALRSAKDAQAERNDVIASGEPAA